LYLRSERIAFSDDNKDWTCKDKDNDFIFTMYKDLQGLYFLQSPCKTYNQGMTVNVHNMTV